MYILLRDIDMLKNIFENKKIFIFKHKTDNILLLFCLFLFFKKFISFKIRSPPVLLFDFKSKKYQTKE